MIQGSGTTPVRKEESTGATQAAPARHLSSIFTDRRSERESRRALLAESAGDPDRRLGKAERRRGELHTGNNDWWLKVNYVATHRYRD